MVFVEGIEDYVAARWGDLVRTLVSLGASVPVAEQVAAEALVRSWSAWPAEHRSGDVDLLVYGELLALWDERPGAAASPDTVVARVLVSGAGLDVQQAEQLTGAHVDIEPLWSADRWDELYAAPAPMSSIREAVRRARRRRLSLLAGSAALTLVLVAVVLLRPGGDRAPEPDPPETPNSIALAWWGDDVLHLGRVVVDTPGLRVLAQAGSDPSYAAVYGDSAGQVVQVEADGSSAPIGTAEPDAPVRGSAGGRVAWIDVTGGDPSVVVWDTATKATVDALALVGTQVGPRARLVAFDGDTVYLAAPGGGLSTWRPGGDDTAPVEADDPRVAALDPATSTARSAVSPSGAMVATWAADGSEVRLAGAGVAERTRLTVPGTRVVAARFVDEERLVVISTRTYLLGRDFDDGVTLSGRFPVADLVTCELASGTCETSQRRVEDVDPSASGSGIVLPG